MARSLRGGSSHARWRLFDNYAYQKQKFVNSLDRSSGVTLLLMETMASAGYRELRKRGGSRDLAWNTRKTHHVPWRLSRSPAFAYALPTRYFVALGLLLLHVNVYRKRRGT
jgi:hypothetical protein